MTGSIIRRFRSQKQLLTRLGLSIQMVLKHGISTQKKDLNVSRFLWIKRPNANGPKIRIDLYRELKSEWSRVNRLVEPGKRELMDLTSTSKLGWEIAKS